MYAKRVLRSYNKILLKNRRYIMTSKQLRLTSDLLNSPLFKNAVGFDRLFSDFFENPSFTSAGGYPPYNVAKVTVDDEVTYEIVLAVAGFKEEDINITVENDQLHIAGESPVLDHGDAYEYLHKGIAERKFTRSFKLAKNVEVKSASLVNGLLKIQLVQIVPEEEKPRTIKIG
jgi:molecular chaperone IbpA